VNASLRLHLAYTARMGALVLASILVSLVIFEIGLRTFEPFGAKPAAANPGGAFGKAELMRYVLQLPAAPGTDRRWFLQDPPPLRYSS